MAINRCPIMIHLNALDFNVCRSEEVISFFLRSVYIFHILEFPEIFWNYLISRKLLGNDQDIPESGKFPSKWKQLGVVCNACTMIVIVRT